MLDCEILDGYSELEGDCNDTSVEQAPNVEEVCDDVDNTAMV